MTRAIILFPLLLAVLLSFGCGGGGGGGATQPKKAVIAFSLISTSKLPFRLNGVQIKATLPTGVTVSTTGTAITTGLAAGSAVSFPLYGTYSAPRRISLMTVDNSSGQNGFGPGEIARLTCALDAGATVSESDRITLENTLTFKASGWDPSPTATTNPSSLNGFLKPKISVTLTN